MARIDQMYASSTTSTEELTKTPYITVKSHEASSRVSASIWNRVMPLLAIAVPIAFSLGLTAVNIADLTLDASTGFAAFLVRERPIAQVIITILASGLAALWGYAVCNTYNLHMRAFISNSTMSLDGIRLSNAITRNTLETRLPVPKMLISFVFCTISALPAWLWTGSLTPSLTLRDRNGIFAAPAYSFLNITGRNPLTNGCLQRPDGSFSTCPAIDTPWLMLDSLGSASSTAAGLRNHSKLDGSGFVYIGRSYGMAAAVNLSMVGTTTLRQSLVFNETGYAITASCSYNESSAWGYTLIDRNDNGIPSIYYATGRNPNSNWTAGSDSEFYVQMAFGDTRRGEGLVSFVGTQSETATEPSYLSIAAGKDYPELNQTQCKILFTPTRFEVTASITNRTIQVLPISNAESRIPDPEPRGALRHWTIRNLGAISSVLTTLYKSSVGEALLQNARRKARAAGLPDASLDRSNLTAPILRNNLTLAAIAESLEAATDDILESIASYALMENDFGHANGTYRSSRISFGSRAFILSTLAVNATAFLLVAGFAIRTGFFKAAPAFDISDIAALLMATRNGSGDGTLDTWRGDPDDEVLRTLRVEMDIGLEGSGAPSIRLI